jgi:murein DD-endopeptidase MepM/ murein hydrolase activator NlpD
MFRSMTDRRVAWRLAPDAEPLPQPWRWPLARIADRDPLIVARLDDDRRGVLLGYERRHFDTELHVPVHAAQEGEIMFAAPTSSGFAVSIDHGACGWATHYAQMSKMFVASQVGRRKRRHVYAGDVIGYAAKSPIQIRFELWQWTDERGFVPVDPIEQMTRWAGPLESAREPALEAA